MFADYLGSVIAVTSETGAIKLRSDSSKMILTYDEYGVPGTSNGGIRFQYTGQAWLPESALYHYKARAYSPSLGRFLQTDPVGYDDGLNWYAYVGNDPIGGTDPSGMNEREEQPKEKPNVVSEVVIKGRKNSKGQGVSFDRIDNHYSAIRLPTVILKWYQESRCSIWEASDALDKAAGGTKFAAIAGGGTSLAFGALVKNKKLSVLGVGVAMSLYSEGEVMSMAANIGKAVSGDFKPLSFDFAGRGLGAATPRMAFKNSATGQMQEFSKSISEGALMDLLQEKLAGKTEECPF